jgi:hypothetical protein
MSDQLEDFIRNNRSQFDDREPADRVWTGVESSLGPDKKRVSLWNYTPLWRAASIILRALTGYLLIPKQQATAPHRDNAIALGDFKDVEAFYTKQISEKVDLIDTFKKNEGLNGFTRDFEQLEAMYMVLKEEMKNHPSDKVKDALVLNLLVRIDLLNQQLHRLEDGEYDGKKKERKAES